MLKHTSKTQHFLYKTLIFLFLTLFIHNSQADNISNEIKEYIKNIQSIALEFSQIDSQGSKSEGMLIINKPYKFRCNYYQPFPLVIVGNKNYVSVYDYEMEHLSRIKSEENIFNFLLVDDVDFKNKFEIISTKIVGNNYVVKLRALDLNKISEISFDKNSKHLKQMKIFEDNNVITLDFGATIAIKNISRSLFIMQDPDIFGKPDRFGKKDLEKRFKAVLVN